MCPALPPPPELEAGGTRVLYFAYGSNLDREQMAQRCASAAPRFCARLEGYRLDFTFPSRRWNGGAADVLPSPGSIVWGAVYELSAPDLVTLDGFELGYERVVLVVRDAKDAVHSVVSYTVRVKQVTAPHPLYLDKMIRWGAHWGFPEDYLEALRRIPPAG
jgi:hypothetical protein